MRKVEEILSARLRGEDVTKDELTQMREATLNIVYAFPEIWDQMIKDANTKNLTVIFFDEVP